ASLGLNFASLAFASLLPAPRCGRSWLEPLYRHLVAPVGEGLADDVLGPGVHYQHQHAAVPLDRVGDLDVEDVDPEPAEQRAHLRDHARAVRHRDAYFAR